MKQKNGNQTSGEEPQSPMVNHVLMVSLAMEPYTKVTGTKAADVESCTKVTGQTSLELTEPTATATMSLRPVASSLTPY